MRLMGITYDPDPESLTATVTIKDGTIYSFDNLHAAASLFLDLVGGEIFRRQSELYASRGCNPYTGESQKEKTHCPPSKGSNEPQ